jgi:diguanylate cyclase (GGDEF)-like protein/PAS domain S-box-containing protein
MTHFIALHGGESGDDLEQQRLQALQTYGVFNTEPENAFDGYIECLAALLRVPIVEICFVGETQVLVKSSLGLDPCFIPRAESLCQYAIGGSDVFIVPDASQDPRFQSTALVSGRVAARFYAAAPLVTPDGFRIGTVCIMDRRARADVSAHEIDTLREFSRAVMRELDARRQLSDLLFQQELNGAIAEARDFQAALETVLRRAGERVGAAYCLVPQQLENRTQFTVTAGVALQPNMADAIAKLIARPTIEEPDTLTLRVLAEQEVIDTGVVTEDMLAGRSENVKQFFALGIRRQIAVPLNLGSRSAAVLVGFARNHIAATDLKFLTDLVTKLVPLLLGRLREEELKRGRLQMDYVNRAMRTLVGANQVLTEATTELGLIQDICRVAVTQGGYSAAWVGFAEQDARQTIRVVAKWGYDFGPLEKMPMTWADSPFGQSASGTAVRENRLVVINDIARAAQLGAFREYPVFEAFRSCIAVPLRTADGAVLGVFSLYNAAREMAGLRDEPSFDIEEEQLLTGLARDIVNGISMIRNRNERNVALAQQQASDARLADLLESSPTVLFALECHDGIWQTVEMTQNFERVLGYPLEETKQEGWWQAHVHPDDMADVQQKFQHVAEAGRAVYQYRLVDKQGGYRCIQSEMTYRPARGNTPARIVGAWADITEKQSAQREIHRLAFYDQLTGLPNRQMLKQKIAQAVAESRPDDFGALLFIDLDRFKAINDAYGHAVGDQVLTTVAKRLRLGLRQGDTVARLGGDEFVVLLPRLGTSASAATERARALALAIGAAVDRQIVLDNLVLRLTASVGIHSFSDSTEGMEQILRSADTAMYSAKSATKNRAWAMGHSNISVFEAAMQERVTQYHAIQNEVKQALTQQRFELWLQPQVDTNDAVIGAEALIRLRRVDGSIVLPDAFIHIAEETGLIVPLGQWVRMQACRLLARYPSAQLPRLSVNISAIEFRQPHIVEEVLALLQSTGTDPARLNLEITENLLIDGLDETMLKLDALAAAGIGLSIDDFGTGYSSLAYLQRLPIREIKIDKRFVRDLMTDRRSGDLTQTLIMLARNFGFDVIAEGVETRSQADFLTDLGCRFMQGFLYGAPRPIWGSAQGVAPRRDALSHIASGDPEFHM